MVFGLQRRGSVPATPASHRSDEDSRETPLQVRRLVALNAPLHKLQISQRTIYERFLPGGTYISAHVARQQPGYFSNDRIGVHIPRMHFVAISFTFHASHSSKQRFKAAEISVGVTCPSRRGTSSGISGVPGEYPRIIKYAPHLVYGAISPENMKWQFNLTGSLGISQTPLNASLRPSRGYTSSATVYRSMRIQGSSRTAYVHRNGPASSKARKESDWDAVPDGEVVWTVEENPLQKSGLPTEFTFVMLISRPESLSDRDVQVHVRVNPTITYSAAHYWRWMLDRWYPPANIDQTSPLTLAYRTGQPFDEDPTDGEEFNFSQILEDFDEQVELPGTTYTLKDPIKTVLDPRGQTHRHQDWGAERSDGRIGDIESQSATLVPTPNIAKPRVAQPAQGQSTQTTVPTVARQLDSNETSMKSVQITDVPQQEV